MTQIDLNVTHMAQPMGRGHFLPVCRTKAFTKWSMDFEEVNCSACLTAATGIGDFREILSSPSSGSVSPGAHSD
jgi:hypothetical protein